MKQENPGTSELENCDIAVQDLLHEKDLAMREMHHRVKNNLQLISSLLKMQARMSTDPETARILNQSHSRVHAIALVHESMYHSSDLAKVALNEYIPNLVNAAIRSQDDTVRRIRHEIHVAQLAVPIDIAVPIGLITSELVNLAVKCSFPSGARGKLSVGFEFNSAGLLAGIIEDDGRESSLLNSQIEDTLGWRIVTLLIKQVGGRIQIVRGTTEPGYGTRFEFEVPITRASAIPSSSDSSSSLDQPNKSLNCHHRPNNGGQALPKRK